MAHAQKNGTVHIQMIAAASWTQRQETMCATSCVYVDQVHNLMLDVPPMAGHARLCVDQLVIVSPWPPLARPAATCGVHLWGGRPALQLGSDPIFCHQEHQT
eukprot:COSAG02_NODE_8385_length_2589_cov_8.057664_2_plen_102_part_00